MDSGEAAFATNLADCKVISELDNTSDDLDQCEPQISTTKSRTDYNDVVLSSIRPNNTMKEEEDLTKITFVVDDYSLLRCDNPDSAAGPTCANKAVSMEESPVCAHIKDDPSNDINYQKSTELDAVDRVQIDSKPEPTI